MFQRLILTKTQESLTLSEESIKYDHFSLCIPLGVSSNWYISGWGDSLSRIYWAFNQGKNFNWLRKN